MTRRLYRLIADAAQVDRAGPPPRPESLLAARRVFWDIPEAELSDVPLLRRWLREHNVTDVHEFGESEQDEPLPSHGEPYHIVSGAWTPWKEPELTRLDPCPGCGLNISTVVVPTEVADDRIDNVLEKLTEAPLCFLPAPKCYVARPDLVEAVRSAGLHQGLVTHPLDGPGRALLLWSDAPLGGPAYPYGPSPCAMCGRAMREAGDTREFAWPNFAYRLTFEAEPAHWSWSTVHGQQTPLVSRAVADLLLDIIPAATFIPHGRPEDPGAFLPEPYRET